MKKFLALLLFVCAQTAFAQETTTTTDTSLRYDPHSLGISFRMGGVIGNNSSYGVQSTVFEFYTRERKGKTKYTPLVGLRFSYPLTGMNAYSYGKFRWGFLFGGSQYVFDKRSAETGTGWSMLVNGGFTTDTPSIKEFIEIAHYPINIGGELEFKAIYNVHKYVGISFGLHMAYALGFTGEQTLKDMISGAGGSTGGTTPPATSEPIPVTLDHSFTIGFNFGVIF